jgi:hypothetical protein
LPAFGAGQLLERPVSNPLLGMGAYSRHHVDAFAMRNNKAALAKIEKTELGIYGERRFMLAETSMYSALVVFPTDKGNFGFQIDYSGFKNFNEAQIGMAYARAIGKKIDIGIKFNYYTFRIPAYENTSTMNFEIGLLFQLSEKLRAGINIYNPVGGMLSKTYGEKLDYIYSIGLGYEISDNFLLCTEIVKQENWPVEVLAGLEYNFHRQFYSRLGFSSGSGSPFAGAGVKWDNIKIEISAGYHPQLGLTPGIIFIYDLKTSAKSGN